MVLDNSSEEDDNYGNIEHDTVDDNDKYEETKTQGK
jgi:hypothetical protein